MTPEVLLEDVRAKIATLAEVRAPVIKRMAAEVYREAKHWPLAQRNRFCNQLWQTRGNGEAILAIYLYQRFTRSCGPCEFRLFERWIDRFVDNWGHCDGVSIYLLGATILNHPELSSELPEWASSPNPWKRRAAAASLVPAARRGLQKPVIRKICTELQGDPDYLVRKARAWLLREAAKGSAIRK